jgi:NAD(P)-dependent dehydrogenase (short-subunit alcohol dehydrogenase family)
MTTFDGDVVVVTGAGNGLGRAHALLFASKGARVVVNDYGGDMQGNIGDLAAAQAVVAEIEQAGGQALADATDVSVEGSGEAIVEAGLRKWGRIDAIVNNAGATRGGISLTDCTDEDFLRTFGIHTLGSVHLARAAWPHFIRQGGGRIINVASDALWGTPAPTYLTAKGANFGLTRALAAEGAEHNIKVNTVMPSAWTRMTQGMPEGEFRELVKQNFPPSAVSPMVVALAHPSCPVSGEAFQVGANRAAKVFLGVTAGYRTKSSNPVEEFLEHIDNVRDDLTWDAPTSMEAAVDVMLERLNAHT